ncbi:hypothetical protein [Myceligenerans crystallogenes]|uniref:Pycsar effector protein domain-containing protein n=1 Tax=Myceligenerans crystallogenes TaxID=316335 RepID=A0ABN2N715_9MICO
MLGWWSGARVFREPRRVPEAPRPDGEPESGGSADAQFVQSMLQLTITNADVKTSVLVAAIALTFGVGTPTIPFAQALVPGAWLAVAGAMTGLAAIVLCGIAGIHLTLSLRPRMKNRDFSRYSLPDIVEASVDDLVATRVHDDRREAWIQAKNLADISAQKHAHIRKALAYYPLSVVLMVLAASIGIIVNGAPT